MSGDHTQFPELSFLNAEEWPGGIDLPMEPNKLNHRKSDCAGGLSNYASLLPRRHSSPSRIGCLPSPFDPALAVNHSDFFPAEGDTHLASMTASLKLSHLKSEDMQSSFEGLFEAPSFAFHCDRDGRQPESPDHGRRRSELQFPLLPPLRTQPQATPPADSTVEASLCPPDDQKQTLFSFPSDFGSALLHDGDTAALSHAHQHEAVCFDDWSEDNPMHTAFHTAAANGETETLATLLTGGFSLEDLWTEAGTPMHFAVRGNSVACLDLLVQAGFELNATNGEGITPLMQAAVMGNEDVMLRLLDLGADITASILPGSSENLLHFCVEHEMVLALKALLQHPDGQVLATSSRMKPIYAALVAMAEADTGQSASTNEAQRSSDIVRARSVVDMLLQHSNLPENASYDDLIMQANASYKIMETTGGSSCDEALDCLLSPHPFSSTSPGAFDPHSSGLSSRGDSTRRMSFTPTANLDCSPAQCSPLSRFHFEPCDSCTPSAMSRHCLTALVSTPCTPRIVRESSSPHFAPMVSSPAAREPETPSHSRGEGAVRHRAEACPAAVSSPTVQTHLRVRTHLPRV